jgi:hypothetical protein
MEGQQTGWDALNTDVRKSLEASWSTAFALPGEGSALYGRWWQLETWLRSLCYVELRTRYGSSWDSTLPSSVEVRDRRDQTHLHMTSPDAHHRLAYLDASILVKTIEDNWELFDQTLLPRQVWAGRTIELLNIRNRIGHCRRPHVDDLGRLEQILRDLEPGLLRAVCAFNDQDAPRAELVDEVAHAWIRGTHPDAKRLLEHADRQYLTRFRLAFSRRPWARQLSAEEPIT